LGSLLLIGLLAWRIDWWSLLAHLAHLDWRLVLAGLGLYVGIQILSSWRWQLLAHLLGLSGSLIRYIGWYFIGMFFNLVLPSSVGGDVVRVWYLGRAEHPAPRMGKRTAALLSVLAERGNGLAVLIVLACLALFACPVVLPLWITLLTLSLGTVAVLGLAGLIGLACWRRLTRRELPAALAKFLASRPRLYGMVLGVLLYFEHPGTLLAATGLSVLVQAGNVVLHWMVGQAMGLEVPLLYYGVAVPLVALLTLLPISLNGMGLREAGMVLLLAPVGVSSAAAVLLALVCFAITSVASLGGAGFYLMGLFPRLADVRAGAKVRRSREKGTDEEPVRGDSDQGREGQPPSAA